MSQTRTTGLAAIKRLCVDGRQHGWGQADSLAVIMAMLPADMPTEERDGFTAVAERMVNPSATRQWLESDAVGLLKPEPKTAKGRGKAAGLANALKAL